jgi:hypothetical protein
MRRWDERRRNGRPARSSAGLLRKPITGASPGWDAVSASQTEGPAFRRPLPRSRSAGSLTTLLAADPTRGLPAPAPRRGCSWLARAGASRRRFPRALARGRRRGLATRCGPLRGGLAGRALPRCRSACGGSSTPRGLGLRRHTHPARHAHLARSLFLGPHRPLVRHLPEPPRLSLHARVTQTLPRRALGIPCSTVMCKCGAWCIQPAQMSRTKTSFESSRPRRVSETPSRRQRRSPAPSSAPSRARISWAVSAP